MSFDAHRCPNGHVTYPGHTVCPECGEEQTETVDLSDETGEVVTWTKSTATPPGVREPNTLAIVEFDVADASVRALGQVTTDEVETGDAVEPVHVDELRNPDAGIRERESQAWDGFRFDPV
ncbi:Zn-ribbon domain-containing OB-fold protein [Halostella litorea]|uniref:Zn-ribbon domain-containing OB-fold protein n=1 Tax=Halostella litorea TaxID=2528831 RepID=UPI001091EFC7|nr:OB-fold domain-containing protein [Halostella litorea]